MMKQFTPVDIRASRYERPFFMYSSRLVNLPQIVSFITVYFLLLIVVFTQ